MLYYNISFFHRLSILDTVPRCLKYFVLQQLIILTKTLKAVNLNQECK